MGVMKKIFTIITEKYPERAKELIDNFENYLQYKEPLLPEVKEILKELK